MKIDTSKKIREVAGEHIVIMQDKGVSDMTKVVALNESALFLYEKLTNRDFELPDIVQILVDEYEVDEATAAADAEAWVKNMGEHGLLK